jgi:uncharacterized lipoprotein YehR (DUF1307 family)
MKLRMKMFVLCAIACFAFGIAGCGEKETAENLGGKVGKNINRTIESAKDVVHDAESATESTKDAIHDATK